MQKVKAIKPIHPESPGWGARARILLLASLVLALSAATTPAQEVQPSIADQPENTATVGAKNTATEGAQNTVTAGIIENFPPQYFVDEKGKPAGLGVDILEELAKRASMKIRYKVFSSGKTLINGLTSGETEVVSTIGITPSRQEILDFSIPVETFRVSVFVRSSTSNVSGLKDLVGETIAVVKANSALKMLQPRKEFSLLVHDKVEDALFSLLSGSAEALAFPEPILMKIAQDIGVENRIKVVGSPLREIKRALTFKKGNIALMERFNAVIPAFIGTPEYQKIYAKWYGSPPPFWTGLRVLLVSGGAIGLSTLLMFGLHWLSLFRINKRLRNEIRERILAEKRFRATFEQAAVGVAHVSTKGRFIRVNQRLCNIFGYPEADLIEKTFQDITHPDDLGEDLLRVESLLSGEVDSFTTEKRYLRKSGEIVWANLTVALVRDEKNEPDYFIAVIENIERRKTAETALQELNHDLEGKIRERTAELEDAHQELVAKERLATLGQVTAMVSHELRNPLGVIQASLFVINKKVEENTNGLQSTLDRAQRSVDRCALIIEEMLEYAGTGKPALQPVVFDNWLQEFLKDYKAPASINLQVELQAEGETVGLGQETFRRVLINLMDNACQAMELDEEEAGKPHDLKVTTHVESENLVVQVRDNGPGMKEDEASRVFEPLFSTKSFGIGLGLPIVRKIVESHGGSIKLENNVAATGAHATVCLPLANTP